MTAHADRITLVVPVWNGRRFKLHLPPDVAAFLRDQLTEALRLAARETPPARALEARALAGQEDTTMTTKDAKAALRRQLARAERLAAQPTGDPKIASALSEVVEILRAEVRALDQEGSAARAEAVAALARQALNVTETLMRLNQGSGGRARP